MIPGRNSLRGNNTTNNNNSSHDTKKYIGVAYQGKIPTYIKKPSDRNVLK